MASPTTGKQWILAKKPKDLPSEETFKLVDISLPELKDGQILVKSTLISNDPAQRTWIRESADPKRDYSPPVKEGEPMRSIGIGKVIASKSSKFPVGTLVRGYINWIEYIIADENTFAPVRQIPGLNETHFLGALGGPGITAYYGLEQVRTSANDAVVVSGAAGATGSMVVQIAKHILGCRKVIGIAGSDNKCRWVESLGADTCINYKSPTFKEDLVQATEGFIDVYFDNVGGEILDLMLTRVKQFGRIAACGAISNYNTDKPVGIKNWFEIIGGRIEIKGFIVTDAAPKFPEYTKILVQAYQEKKITIGDENETIIDTKFEDIPKTWAHLFSGGNTGKLVTRIVD